MDPIDWPAIDRIYDDPLDDWGLPPWPEGMYVPEPGDDWWRS
jgi:hypothetical protein